VLKLLEAEERLADALASHVGEWVAVRNHIVVDSAVTLSELLDRVDPSSIDRTLQVTEDSDSSFLL